MKTRLLFAILMLLAIYQSANSQTLHCNPKAKSIIAQKMDNSDLLVPIEIEFINTTNSTINPLITIRISNTYSKIINQFNNEELAKIRIINNSHILTLNPNSTFDAKNIFYMYIDKSVSIKIDKVIYLDIIEGNEKLSTLKITFQPEIPQLSLSEYLDSSNIINYLTTVESSENILTINGFKEITSNEKKDTIFVTKKVALKNNQVFAASEKSYILNISHWQPIPFSIITIPYKIRPKITEKGTEYKTLASAGLTNIGLNLDLASYKMDRYFANSKKSSHKFSLGFWASPSVEELDSVFTKGYIAKDVKSKQLFVSTGLTITYSYNDVSFVFVPCGWDFSTSSIGKNWVYDGRKWIGFGIAISPKIFATQPNK